MMANLVRIRVGKRIKKLRRERGFYIEDMSRYINISQETYIQYEKGEIAIPRQNLESIADIFFVKIAYFFINKPYESE